MEALRELNPRLIGVDGFQVIKAWLSPKSKEVLEIAPLFFM